jgi:hypothetical protein
VAVPRELHHERGVVEVAARSVPARRRQRLEDAAVEAHGMPAGSQRDPVQVDDGSAASLPSRDGIEDIEPRGTPRRRNGTTTPTTTASTSRPASCPTGTEKATPRSSSANVVSHANGTPIAVPSRPRR